MPHPKEHPPVVSPKSAFVDESGDPNRLAKSSLFFALGAVLIKVVEFIRGVLNTTLTDCRLASQQSSRPR